MIYIAIIGDIISSKSIKERSQAQKKLMTLIADINKKYEKVLKSPFTITTGDEFQALLLPNHHVFEIIESISLNFLPYHLRFGIGVGEILTDINEEQSIGSDGPAYWYARKAIDYIHDNNDYGTNSISLYFDDHYDIRKAINASIAASEFIKSKWTTTQSEIVKKLLEINIYDEKFEHKKIAELLSVTPSAFNKRIKASGLKIYLRLRRTIMVSILNYIKMEENSHD
ncbi:SatD family protein [Streptococcus zalophi]|uniref:DNA-binding protein n=1 Tax=Streptococcus zalophi TaxID=640031 RepID=A0A934UDA5_9STRE|nr:SatD family protein [Streptococcus zalophi]MBJ8349469.1 DNA-binding protein [Streptococcus zalophi]MCR8967336.1 SatD family protein [Streptococcus zalophi]